MEIRLTDVGKKYSKTWIFRHVNHHFKENSSTAIIGKNGSGKSTLLQIASGFLSPTEGKASFYPASSNQNLEICFVAPYSEIIDEFTVKEFLHFHAKFKTPNLSFDAMLERASLDKAGQTIIRDLSSGMKQRLKLILAFFFKNEVLLLDEPTSNLDEEGISWYRSEIQSVEKVLLIIASNEMQEYDFCEKKLAISDFE